MTTDPRRVAVLALHWQVNVIEPEGYFGEMLAEPVRRSGVVARAARFHAAAPPTDLLYTPAACTVDIVFGTTACASASAAVSGGAEGRSCWARSKHERP